MWFLCNLGFLRESSPVNVRAHVHVIGYISRSLSVLRVHLHFTPSFGIFLNHLRRRYIFFLYFFSYFFFPLFVKLTFFFLSSLRTKLPTKMLKRHLQKMAVIIVPLFLSRFYSFLGIFFKTIFNLHSTTFLETYWANYS